jgi:hypothetical protein
VAIPVYDCLSVTPHVEPTHTHYDERYQQVPPRYGGWRGQEHGDPRPDASTDALADEVLEAARRLRELADRNVQAVERQARDLKTTLAAGEDQAGKATIDAMWAELRDTLQHVRELERRWSALAPRSMPSA